ncbi:MAG: methylated-DNA--[protein]-cysteine S-methyltransferase, partial [Caulobacteraceae bacterium]
HVLRQIELGTRRARLSLGGAGSLPPGAVRAAIEAMTALLAGEPRDLSPIVLDLTGVAQFDRRVHAVARAIPPGETATYGEIAARLGEPGAAREVGRALGANPFPIVVPCHRVLAAGGKAGGFSAPGGVATKARMLSIERARTSPAPLLFDSLPISVKGGETKLGTNPLPRETGEGGPPRVRPKASPRTGYAVEGRGGTLSWASSPHPLASPGLPPQAGEES